VPSESTGADAGDYGVTPRHRKRLLKANGAPGAANEARPPSTKLRAFERHYVDGDADTAIIATDNLERPLGRIINAS
jgi:hypothetical protein